MTFYVYVLADYIGLWEIDKLGEDLSLCPPFTKFFRNLSTGMLKLMSGDMDVIRMKSLGISDERFCKIYFQDATPIAFNLPDDVPKNVVRLHLHLLRMKQLQMFAAWYLMMLVIFLRRILKLMRRGPAHEADDEEDWLNMVRHIRVGKSKCKKSNIMC